MTLIAIAFLTVGTIVAGITRDDLVRQRVLSELARADGLAERLAAPLALGNAEAVDALCREEARALVVDRYGVVQADPLGEWLGVRLNHPEVRAVVDHMNVHDSGFHAVPPKKQPVSEDSLFTRVRGLSDAGQRTLMTVSTIMGGSERLGAVVLVTSADDLVKSIQKIQGTITIYFVVVACAVIMLGYWISGYIARPINALNSVMTRAMRGDFSVRARVKGRDEVAQLGATFNMMTEKLGNLDHARSTFISNASHELKTPLSGIKLLTENMLMDPNMPEEVRNDFLNDIKSEIDRLSVINNDLLTLVQADSKGMRLYLTDFDLADSAKATVRRLGVLAESREVRLSLETLSPAPVRADRSKLDQVLYNLIDNALKYTPKGGSVYVMAGRTEEGGLTGEVFVQVRDTGVGIPEEDLPHIFDRFFRVDKARSRATGGTGLGLAIVRDIVALMRGDVKVDSVEGKGSVFTLTLPARPEDEEE